MRLLVVILFVCLVVPAWAKPKVRLYITVDWEGVDFHSQSLADEDLLRLQQFRHRYPHIPLVHFLNPAYYVNGDYNKFQTSWRINSVLRPQDEFGLHLHAWENLVRAAGLEYIDGPTYFGDETSQHVGKGNSKNPKGHRGGDVPLWRYSKDELRRLIEFSLKTLNGFGFYNITSFRAGGWQSHPKVAAVLEEFGFRVDSSPVPGELVRRKYPGTPLANLVQRLWPKARRSSQPYFTKPVFAEGFIMAPNNAGLADYVDVDTFAEIFKKNLKTHSGEKDIHIVYGFHLESAAEYLDRVEGALAEAQILAAQKGFDIEVTTFERSEQALKQSALAAVTCKSLF